MASGRPRLSQNASVAASFVLCVALPVTMAAIYLANVARPQYASTVAFTVRANDGGAMSEALTGIARFAGAPGNADAMILSRFLESQTFVERIERRLGIRRHYSLPYREDPVFALNPAAPIEGLVAHWRRVSSVAYEPSTGLVSVRVLAFSPGMAQRITQQLLLEGHTLINELNAQAGAEAIAQAEADLSAAEDRLERARTALTEFRIESGVIDPDEDLNRRMGVVRHLQSQLAQALVHQDTRGGGPAEADLRVVSALRNRIASERAEIVAEVGHDTRAYPDLLATHQRLVTQSDIAEEAFRAALAARDVTVSNALGQTRYLAVYVQPTLPERADHPRTAVILGLGAAFLGLGWAILVLTCAAIRDRH